MMRAMLLLLAILTAGAKAQPDEAATPVQPFPETAKLSNIALWPGTAPGSENVAGPENYSVGKSGGRLFWNVSRPMMTAFYAAKPNGAAVLVIPGGGYRVLYFDFAAKFARWLNTQGIDAFVLKHRLPDEGHRAAYSVPLQDAQRAMRLIRSSTLINHAIDPARIGVFGLSAGGNLAGVLATYHDRKVYEPIDDMDTVSARPDFMILAYAVLPRPYEVQDNDRRPNATRLYRSFPVGMANTTTMPPAFIMHGDRDEDVPYTESKRLALKLQDAGVPAELHIFPGAGHGFGVEGKGEERVWPELCAKWLRARAIIPATRP